MAFLMYGCFHSETPKNETPSSQSIQSNTQNLEERIAKLNKIKQAIVPFFKLMGKPADTDWLASNKELGQTFEEYVKNHPTLLTSERRKIYIQPIGNFSETERKVLRLTAAYMRIFYNLPVELKPEQALANVPSEMMRKNLYSHQTQIKTTYFLKDLLPKMLPPDAAALICFTNSDLFPDNEWSYVFGQATLQNRVGVWSLYRFGNPNKSDKNYQLFLARTLKIAMHETGHMFSMWHCTKYECLMSGTNNLNETDRRPIDFCPECMAKIAWGMNYDPAERYKNLAKFWADQGQPGLSKEFEAKERAVRQISIH